MFVLDDAGATLIGMAVIVFGYVVFGLTGFGASLFTIPVLTHFYPLPFVLVLAGLLDVAAVACGLAIAGTVHRECPDAARAVRAAGGLRPGRAGAPTHLNLFCDLKLVWRLLALAIHCSSMYNTTRYEPTRPRPPREALDRWRSART